MVRCLYRRNLIGAIGCFLLCASIITAAHSQEVPAQDGPADRAYTVSVMTRIAGPVLTAASKGQLHTSLPIYDWEQPRAAWTHYEAFARTMAGIAPWLELGPDDTPEGQQRAQFITMARQSLINATDPTSPDYMNFGQIPDQPLVESAYLSSALLLAPQQLWQPLTDAQKKNVVDALHISLDIKLTHNNNWRLFPAMITAALWKLTGEADLKPIKEAVDIFENEWYLGDGTYGDGPMFHWDYYNSYVIHPMLLQVLEVAREKKNSIADSMPTALARGQRYAVILERLISPEGTFPVMGRSSAYRYAAFYHLSYMALIGQLPTKLDPGAVRGAVTSVVRKMTEAPGTFSADGWLNLGAVGAQPGLTEDYNSTGSLYICLVGLVSLGLPANSSFWTAPPAPWTQQLIWRGEDVPLDHALKE